MSIAFSTLKTRLQNAVAARSGVPSSDQYDQALREAVSDFNERASRLKVTTINVVTNTALYALPSDFVKFVELQSPLTMAVGNTIVTGQGLVPLPATFDEQVTIEGANLRITPTPSYTMTRDLWYGAGYVESGSPVVYAEMSEREARIILLLAKAIAGGYKVDVAANSGITSVQIGDVRVDKSRVTQDLQAQAEVWQTQYETEVDKYVSTITRRAYDRQPPYARRDLGL